MHVRKRLFCIKCGVISLFVLCFWKINGSFSICEECFIPKNIDLKKKYFFDSIELEKFNQYENCNYLFFNISLFDKKISSLIKNNIVFIYSFKYCETLYKFHKNVILVFLCVSDGKVNFGSIDELNQMLEYVYAEKFEYNFEFVKTIYKNNNFQLYFVLFLAIILGIVFWFSIYLFRNNIKFKSELNKKLNEIQDIKKYNVNIEHKSREVSRKFLNIYKKMVILSLLSNQEKYKEILMNYNQIIHERKTIFTFDWDVYISLLNDSYDNFDDYLSNNFDFTKKEQQVILLQKGGFSIQEVADVLQMSIHTVYKYNSKIRKKIKIINSQNIIVYLSVFR